MYILAIIPARGGSNGIVRKNLRLLNQKPLICYQIQNALRSEFIDDVVVTSDDEDILSYSSSFPVYLRKRPVELASDMVTLDPVVDDAIVFMEFENNKKYDVVITLQPTSPLLSFKTLDDAIKEFIDKDVDTLLPVIDATHLHWKEYRNSIVPDYEERLNRQWLPRKFKETGAFLISKRCFVNSESRFGDDVGIFVLDELEGLDIDTSIDFLMAETAIKRLRISFVVNGNQEVGMGHIQRCLTIADGFIGHDIKFFTYNCDSDSLNLITDRGYSVMECDKELLWGELDSDIVINDVLDTNGEYVRRLRDSGFFIVNFEDLGDGSNFAHLVFNALYEKTNPKLNHRFGYEYECLNEHFLLYSPIEYDNFPKTLFVTFGGVDQNNLTLRVLKVAPRLFEETSLEKIILVLGGGYSHNLDLDIVDPMLNSKIEIYRKVRNMPKLMSKADVAITSNGRTIYELASMSIPTISIAQNDRETLHLFARYNGGINYLGISCTVKLDDIFNSIYDIVNNNDLRRKMYFKQKNASIIIRKGLIRIINEITSEYWKWKYDQEY